MPLPQNHIAVVIGAGSGVGRAIGLGYVTDSMVMADGGYRAI